MDNNIESRVNEFVKKNELIHKDDHVIVGLSGGADSTCLLYILYKLRNEFNLKLTAIHINHMIRGDEALRDEEHVINFCNNLGIDVVVERIDVIKLASDKKISTEEAGRYARYDMFHKYKGKLSANKIAVAHNKNDNAETIFMNIVRGCGPNGLKGIDFKREDIIRPLMVLKREEIEKYCNDNNLKYVTDSTNNEPIYTRNKIRLKLIKIIDDILDVDIVSKIDKMSQLVREDNDFIRDLAKKDLKFCELSSEEGVVILSVKRLKTRHKSIQRRIILEAILKVKKDLRMMEYKHVDSILVLIENSISGKVCLPKNIRVTKSYDKIIFYKEGELKKDTRIFSINLDNSKEIVNDEFNMTAEIFDCDGDIDSIMLKSSESVSFFDYDKLGSVVEIRKRRDGDVFKPLKSNGTKKLKKYFIDNKIDRLDREKFYLLTKGKEVVWIIGDKMSDKYKITKNTRKIVRVVFISMI